MLTLFTATIASAEVKLPAIISDGMMIQCDRPVAIWGWADAGEPVSVTFASQAQSCVAGADGKWRVNLSAVAKGTAGELRVVGKNTLVVRDVLAGEVWLCGGQSNMMFRLKDSVGAADVVAKPNPKVRGFVVGYAPRAAPESDCVGTWQSFAPPASGEFSAVGSYFGLALAERLDSPVGLVQSYWGASSIEAWTPREALKTDPSYPQIEAKEKEWTASRAADQAKWEKLRDAWVEEAKAAALAGKPRPKPPKTFDSMREQMYPTLLYNGMIAPIVPYSFRGTIWYQGEANAAHANRYKRYLPLLIKTWRGAFENPDMPFGIVQLANILAPQMDPNELSAWALLRDMQLLTVKTVPNTGLAVTIDVGEANDIHPKQKRQVGERLASWALATVYGHKEAPDSGPIWQSMTVENGSARLKFTGVMGGLKTRDGQPPLGFVIAGRDQKFANAHAKIVGNEVIVSAPEVSSPVAVRYGWANNPTCTLENGSGMPASPFRTDDWDALPKAPAAE